MCPRWISSASKPPSTATLAPRAKSAVTRAMSSGVSAWVKRRRSGLQPARRREDRDGLGRVGDGAGVSELGGRRRAFGVDGVGQPSQAGDRRRRAARSDGRRCRRRATPRSRPPCTAPRRLPQNGGGTDQLVGDDLIGRPPLEGGRLDDAVAQPDRASVAGAKGSGAGSPRRSASVRRPSPDQSGRASDTRLAVSNASPVPPRTCGPGRALAAGRRARFHEALARVVRATGRAACSRAGGG